MITLLLSFFVLYFTVDHDKVKANQMQQSLLMKLQESGLETKAEKKLSPESQLHIGTTDDQNIDAAIVKKLGAKVHVTGDRLLIEFPNVSFFDLGIVEVNSAGESALSKFVNVYQPYLAQYTLSIGAFTDTRPVKLNHRFKDNLELSALRSVATMRVLQKLGIPLLNMRVSGFGEMIINAKNILNGDKSGDPLRFSRKVILSIEPKERDIQ
jgi:flagellar motor protein MotB